MKKALIHLLLHDELDQASYLVLDIQRKFNLLRMTNMLYFICKQFCLQTLNCCYNDSLCIGDVIIKAVYKCVDKASVRQPEVHHIWMRRWSCGGACTLIHTLANLKVAITCNQRRRLRET